MVADRPLLTSRPHGDLKTIAGHVDADENLSRHKSSALANCLHSPNLAGCGLAARPRQLFGLTAGPDWATKLPDGLDRTKGVTACPSPFTSSSAHPWEVTKIQGGRSELASGATTGGGGPARLPRPGSQWR